MKSTFDKEMQDPDFKKEFEKEYMKELHKNYFEKVYIENLCQSAESEGSNWPHGMVHSFSTAIKRIALYAALWLGPPVISIALYYFGFYDSFFNRVGIATSSGVFFMVTLALPIFAICIVYAAGLILIVIVGLLSCFFPWLYRLGYVSADELKKDEEKIVVVFFPYSKRKYSVIVRKKSEEEGGGFLASICEHPNCTASGETRSKAIDNLKWNVRNPERK